MQRRYWLVLLSFLLGASPAAAQGDKLAGHKAAYEREKKAARDDALKAFDTLIDNVRKNSKLPGSTRTSLITQITQQKQSFESSGVWPDNGDLFVVAYNYAWRLGQKYVPLHTAYEKAIDQLLKANKLDEAQKLAKEKEELEAELSGQKVGPGTKWHGTRSNGNANSAFHLNINKKTGNLIEANVHLSPAVQNHDILEVRGTVNGNFVSLDTVKMVRGKNRRLLFNGFINGTQMILFVGGIAANGKPVSNNDRVVLHLK